MAERRCIICEQPKDAGVNLLHVFICDDCEEELVNTEVEDEKYRFFVHRLRQVWLKKEA